MINPLTFPGWNDLLLSQRAPSFFHTAEWARVLHETYAYDPVYLARIEQGELAVLIPLMEIRSRITGKRGVSLPFSDYCETIIARNINAADILHELIDYGRKAGWVSIELMDGRHLPPDTLTSSSYFEHSLDLDRDGESIFSSFSENIRRNIKKALQNEIKVSVGNSEGSVDEFYRLHCLTRRRHGLPPQPVKFFRSIYAHIISNNLGFSMLAKHNGLAIAGAIYYHFGAQAIFKYGASDMRYKMLGANSLLMWRAIEQLAQKGCRELSLGRTDMDNEGLRRFKRGWGTVERVITYYKYDLRKEAFVKKPTLIFEHQKKLFRMMPLFLLRMTGSLLYKHIG